MAKKQAPDNNKLIVENRRARYDYSIEDVLECGIILMGSEVKALRIGSANIAESYVDIENGELWLINSYVSLYTQAQNFGHEERRRRKLLVSKKQISKLWQAKGRQAMCSSDLYCAPDYWACIRFQPGVQSQDLWAQ